MKGLHARAGFTLIELITTLVILVIVSVGISGFIRSSMQVFSDVTERDRILGDSRFVVQRMTRELRDAVPSSLRVAGNSSVHCLQFVPIDYSTFYTQLPLLPAADTALEVVEMSDIDNNVYVPDTLSTFAFVFTTRAVDVYDPSLNRRRAVEACEDDGPDTGCASADSPTNTAQLTVAGAFAAGSPAERVYFASRANSYCVRDEAIYFHQSDITAAQPVFTSGGVLMAENIANTLSANPAVQSSGSDDPFRLFDATLLRNAFVQLRLRFELNEEVVNYHHEVHVANVP
ncbi:PilW family protein [Alteromonas oceanisediminis]|uniref:PilW family protein n=1 Tax=Alteromonas oceanisediminis TaxID=2836180 RepID=UPI001BDB65C6|nr:prepilin-type N-terminal cleavage/methylation domain-containing protein [Alteromonas oceanisediminis]MBT0586878.1 prepilin-type N-terminal cleavage/methylation domain-containing protein [Alteromonas oceanisediminis]